MKVITAKKFKYNRLTSANIVEDVNEALFDLTGPALKALADFEIEEHEDFAGTFFVNVYVENKTQSSKVTRALRKACTNGGHNFEVCAKFGEFDTEENGAHAGRCLVYFYVTDYDFPGCDYEEVER